MSFRPLLVTRVVDETTSARSFRLQPAAKDAAYFRYRAGQNLLFRLEIDGEVVEAPYSLSSAPETDSDLQITVQQVEDGRASMWLNQEVAPGDELLAGPPTGGFVLNGSSRPLTLIAAGSGITPIFSILKSALTTTARPIFLLYANRHPERAIFKSEIDRLAAQHDHRFACRHHFDIDHGLMTPGHVRDALDQAPEGEVYVCGPEPVIRLVWDQASAGGIPPARVITEDFGPPDPAT